LFLSRLARYRKNHKCSAVQYSTSNSNPAAATAAVARPVHHLGAFNHIMPVYLCQPGAGHAEPWRHGIQVYATPCPIDSKTPVHAGGGGRDLVVANWTPPDNDHKNNNSEGGGDASDNTATATATAANASTTTAPAGGFAVRRVRHAEVVIVDDICVAYDRYWLRLRWPGHKGGFAGYIAMGIVSETQAGMDPRKGRL
jgi:hypothetical protein